MAFICCLIINSTPSIPSETVTLVQEREANTAESKWGVSSWCHQICQLSRGDSLKSASIRSCISKWIILWAYFPLSKLLWNIDGWVYFPHQWPLPSVSGELVKSRVRGWAGYDTTAERSVMDCHSKVRGGREARPPDKGYIEKENDLFQTRHPAGSEGVSWLWVTFKLCWALFILSLVFLSLSVCLSAVSLPKLAQSDERAGSPCCLTGEMSKYVRWRNLPTQAMKGCGGKALGTWSYFYF